MENFGRIFKKFRESRQLSLKDVSGKNLSTSHLSRFKHGESDLTITKFMMALDAINMPIEEFMYAVHDFKRDELNELLVQIREHVSNRDVSGLQKLLIAQQEKTNTHRFHYLNIILIKIRLQVLSGETHYNSSDITALTDYLFSVEYWGNYELLLFMNTLDALTHESFMVLAREMTRRSDFYKEIPNNRRLVATMNLNSYITCIERQEFMDALYFEKQLNACFFTETELYERLVFAYAKAFFQYQKKKKKNNLKKL